MKQTLTNGTWSNIRGMINNMMTEIYDKCSSHDESVQNLSEAIENKQDSISSGQHIKTINGQSIVGAGDLVLQVTGQEVVFETVTVTQSRQLSAADIGKTLKCTNTTDITLSATNIGSTDDEIKIVKNGTGEITIGATGTTVNSLNNQMSLAGQYSVAYLKKMENGEWLLYGDITTIEQTDPTSYVDVTASTISEINAALIANNGSNVRFAQTEITIDDYFKMDNLDDMIIDFNLCKLNVPNDPSFSVSSMGTFPGSSDSSCVGLIANGSSNLTIKNLRYDGGVYNVTNHDAPNMKNVQGIIVGDATNITFENCVGDHFNHHTIWLSTNSHNIYFNDCEFYNCAGKTTSADVYIATNHTGYVELNRTVAMRDTMSGDKFLYAHDGNVVINDLYCENIETVLDFRLATLNFTDVEGDNCGNILISQSPDRPNGANITGTNLIATNMYGEQGIPYGENSIKTGFAIYDCESCNIDGISLSYATDTPSGYYNMASFGMLIRKIYADSAISNVNLSNVTIANAKSAGIYFRDIGWTTGTDIDIDNLIITQNAGKALEVYGQDSNSSVDITNIAYRGSVSTVVGDIINIT